MFFGGLALMPPLFVLEVSAYYCSLNSISPTITYDVPLTSGIGLFSHINRCWDNRAFYLFGPKKVNWEEECVVVTGGASGIGALLVETLVGKGATVIVLDIVRPSLCHGEFHRSSWK